MTALDVRIETSPWSGREILEAVEGENAHTDVERLTFLADRTVTMTVENRGAVIRLRRNQRAVWGDRQWLGLDYRLIELRVWHDGSVSIEREVER